MVRSKAVVSAALILTAAATHVLAGGAVILTARGEREQRPVVGVEVTVSGTQRSGVSDAAGVVNLRNIPAGEHSLITRAIGYTTDTTSVTVVDNETARVAVELKGSISSLPTMTVVGMREGQSRALNEQKAADNIKNVVSADYMSRFPDQNSAEALQRVTGISVQRDQGEGRYVQVRGAEARMTSVSINGVSIPAPEGEVRSVALDVIPSDVLSSIEVNKALTPEMDGDAIGGSVNLKTRKAVGTDLTFSVTGALGYNAVTAQREESSPPLNGQGSFSLGKRFGEDGAFGLLVGGSYMRTNRASDNMEFSWDGLDFNPDGSGYSGDRAEDDSVYNALHPEDDTEEILTMEEVEFRDYTVTRDRIGANLTLDFNVSPSVNVYVSGLYNRFGDTEFRRATTIAFAPDDVDSLHRYSSTSYEVLGAEIEKETKDRYEVQDILSVVAGTELSLHKLSIDGYVAYSYAQEDEPDAMYSVWAGSDDFTYDLDDQDFPEFDFTSDFSDPASYEFDELEAEDNLTTDRNIEGVLNVSIPLSLGQFPLELKGGLKGRQKTKDRDNTYEVWGAGTDLVGDDYEFTVEDVGAGEYSNEDYLDGRYPDASLAFPSAEEIRDKFADDRYQFEMGDDIDMLEDNWAGDYEATENVGAAYLQAKLGLGKVSLLLGLRGEYSGMHYQGYRVDMARADAIDGAGGDVEDAVSEERGYKNDWQILPMAHVKLAVTKNTNVRMAYTKSFSRPNYFDLVPYYVLNDDGDEAEIGNSDLEMTEAHNIDILGEHYFSSIGILSGGFFYKSLADFIYYQVDPDVNGIEVVQPVNGDRASILGLEATWEQQFTFLPSVLSGLGIGANYTFTWSDAEIEAEVGEGVRSVQLPGQAAHTLNASISYQKYGFTGRLSLNYHSEFLDEVGGDEDEDRYYDDHVQVDLSLSQKLLKKQDLVLFAEFLNLTNEPLRYYQVVDDEEYTQQQEYYRWWAHFGLKYTF